MITTSRPLNASGLVGRLSRRRFMWQFPRMAFGALSPAWLHATPGTGALATMNVASAVGGVPPLELQTLPDPVWAERIRGSQRLSFDLGIRNYSSSEWELSFIGLRVSSGGKTIYLNHLDLGGGTVGSIQTLGETRVAPDGYLYLFNPFPALDSQITLEHVRCSLFFTVGSQRIILATDIYPRVYQQRNRFRVPLKGRLFLMNGHDYYSSHRRHDLYTPILRQLGFPMTNANRYALDFIVVDETGATYRGGNPTSQDYFGFGRLPFPVPARNEDYIGFGAPILAPAAGRVIASRGDLSDNLPLQFAGFPLDVEKADRMISWGNHIIIDHGNGEYFVLAHCQRGSTTVRPGDAVKPGQVVAKVGSSGAAAFPHLHCQLIERPEPVRAQGLPVTFSDFDLVFGSKTVHILNDCPDTGDFLIA